MVTSLRDQVGTHGRHRGMTLAPAGSAEAVRTMTSAAACAVKWTAARTHMVLGDGAEWMTTRASETAGLAQRAG